MTETASAADLRFGDVPVWHVPYVWAEAGPLIGRALDRDGSGRFLPDDILKILLAGQGRLWIVWSEEAGIVAAVVTQIVDFPRLRELRIWLVGARKGRLPIRMMRTGCSTLIEYGRAHGCTLLAGGLRRGWQRMADGFRETGVLYEMRL